MRFDDFARVLLALALAVMLGSLSRSATAQQIDSDVSSDFSLSTVWGVGSGILGLGGTGIDGQVTQMNFGADDKLYVAVIDGAKGGASGTEGIWRFDYSTTGLSNPFRVSTLPTTSLAFHTSNGTEYMYVSDAIDIFGSGASAQTGILRRMTDTNGDGIWGGTGDINQILTDNVPVEREHRMNQITFSGNTLITGIGSLSTDGHDEAAYPTTIGFIEDVTQLGTGNNAARLGSSSTFINGGVPTNDTTPFTNTDPDKFRVHSVGVRNPYGVVTDPDGNSYATMNNDQQVPNVGTPADLFFQLVEKGNYGFAHQFGGTERGAEGTPFVQLPGVGTGGGEAGYAETKNVNSITTEGVVAGQYDPDNPNGSLGPSAAVGGVDFNTNNNLLLEYHKDAFIPRWTFQDVVAVDIDTGEVERIAHGFNRSLEIVRDPFGNILVSEAPLGDSERARIFLIQGVRNRPGESHLINLLNQTDSVWSDRSAWGGDFDDDGFVDAPFLVNPDDKIVPHQWEGQKYDVEINRAVANLTITLDQDAHINNLLLGNELRLTSGNVLTVDQIAAINEFGVLKGNGIIDGDVVSAGNIRTGDSVGMIEFEKSFTQLAAGTIEVEIDSSSSFDVLAVKGDASLDGLVDIILNSYQATPGEFFDVLTAASIADLGIAMSPEDQSQFGLSIVDLGNVQALRVTALPEPASLLLVMAGILGLSRRRSH